MVNKSHQFQYVTTAIFKEVIKHQFPINAETGPAKDLPALTYEESNALRYAAGYVPRALRKRLEKGSHPLKEEIILCLAETCDDEGDGGETDFSADWTKEVSRGGLKLVNNKSYQFFYAVEMVIRRHLTRAAAPTISAGFKETLTQQVTSDENVLFFWSIVAVEWEEEKPVLLRMIIDLWITIRGFSFANSWLEMYKQENKKTVQKSKGVRKQLIGTTASSSKGLLCNHVAYTINEIIIQICSIGCFLLYSSLCTSCMHAINVHFEAKIWGFALPEDRLGKG